MMMVVKIVVMMSIIVVFIDYFFSHYKDNGFFSIIQIFLHFFVKKFSQYRLRSTFFILQSIS